MRRCLPRPNLAAMASASPRILILRTGHTASQIVARHGDYDAWFTAAMADTGCEFSLRHVPQDGVGSMAGFDGILVTGTPASVRDGAAWMEPLGDYLGLRADTGPPLLAVCFGAQLAAHGLGGTVERNPRGWEIGTVTVDLTEDGRGDPLFAGLPQQITVQATHQDHVAELPADTTLLATNDKTAIQAFAWGTRLRALQFHPEAGVEILGQLVDLRRAILEADARLQGAMDGPTAAAQVQALADGLRPSGHGRTILANWVTSYVRGSS